MSIRQRYHTRFWEITYLDSDGVERRRLVQGPKSYRASKVKKDLRVTCPEMKILTVKRVKRPDWSNIFEIVEDK